MLARILLKKPALTILAEVGVSQQECPVRSMI